MGMFRDFGCMLLLKCKVDTEGKADLERLLEGRHKLKGTVKRQLMTVSEELAQLWAPGEQDGSGDTGEYEGSQNVREMFQTALEEIFHFCLYSKGGKNRYLLPEETAKPLLRLITLPEGMMAGNEGLVVLDTQCGAGSVLMAASRYLKNPRLMGYEKDEEMWAAAVIMSQLSGLEMELHLEDGARADLYESCDLVISNPVYGTDTIKDEELIDQLPGELKTVRGRYHMELIRSMQALNFDGKAMLIVPNSFLFANRTESMKVRKWLLQSYSLEAIISLPEDTFMYSGVRSSVMVFSKPFMSGGWEGHTQRVLYYNLEKQEDKEKQQKEYETSGRGMEPERQLLWKMGALPQGKNGGKPQRYKGSCKLAVQQFLVCRCGSDRGGKMEPSAGKLQTGRADQSGNRGPGSSFAGDA